MDYATGQPAKIEPTKVVSKKKKSKKGKKGVAFVSGIPSFGSQVKGKDIVLDL